MAKAVPVPTFADTYGGVVVVSCAWIIMAYMFMPLGPIAGLKKCSEGQQKWCVSVTPVQAAPIATVRMISPPAACLCAGDTVPF